MPIKAGRILTQATAPTNLLKHARRLRHLVGNIGRHMTKVSADGGGKGIVDIEEGVGLEGFWEHAGVLEVDDPDISSPDVVEEVVLANVGMIDEEIVRKRYGWRRVSPAARKRLRESNGSITCHESSSRVRFIP
jgi:hypothetical protein